MLTFLFVPFSASPFRPNTTGKGALIPLGFPGDILGSSPGRCRQQAGAELPVHPLSPGQRLCSLAWLVSCSGQPRLTAGVHAPNTRASEGRGSHVRSDRMISRSSLSTRRDIALLFLHSHFFVLWFVRYDGARPSVRMNMASLPSHTVKLGLALSGAVVLYRIRFGRFVLVIAIA